MTRIAWPAGLNRGRLWRSTSPRSRSPSAVIPAAVSMRLRSTTICSPTSFPLGLWSISVSPPTVTLNLPLCSSFTSPMRLQQGEDVTPLDVVADRVGQDRLRRAAMVVVEVGGVGLAHEAHYRRQEAAHGVGRVEAVIPQRHSAPRSRADCVLAQDPRGDHRTAQSSSYTEPLPANVVIGQTNAM